MAQGIFSEDSFELVDASILNLVLLPIIIYQGGWSLNLPHFSAQFSYCLIFAIAGTIVTMVVIGYANWYMANFLGWHHMTSLRTNLCFGALISATDPVATLVTYAELGIAKKQPLLNTLVVGESLINDAVAIVFFNALNAMGKAHWHGVHVGIVTQMALLLFGSMILGVLVSSALIFTMRIARLPGQTTMEILYVSLAPFLIFSLADALELSGIIAVLFAGIMMKTYATQHLTTRGREILDEFLGVNAKLADTGVFILCGTSTALTDSMEGFKFGALAVLLCLVARAVATLVCSVGSNALKSVIDEYPLHITCKHGFMIWLGGLRGGVALVLALEIDTDWCDEETKGIIINMVFIVICALLLLCGGTTEFFLVALGMVEPPKEGPRRRTSAMNLQEEDDDVSEEMHQLNMLEEHLPMRYCTWLDSWFEYILVGEYTEAKRCHSSLIRHT